MHKTRLFLKIAVTLLIISLILVGTATAAPDTNRNFVAPLSGREEVPLVDTTATGVAIFHLSKDGSELSYKLIVSNIEDVTQAHIHLAPAGSIGGVVTFLYGFGPTVTPNGILAEGTITEGDLVGALAGQPLSSLIDEMRAGNAYVNVHTVGVPSGEIRGQIH